jgi:predicted alpha/beta hydrolase family esterase
MAELWPVGYILAMKRAIIVHGWGSHDQDGWLPWLKKELESQGFLVDIPAMPHPMVPTIDDWVNALSKAVGQIDSDTVFIGHSIGCQTILRYLMTIQTPIRGAVFVAGFFKLDGLRTEMERRHAAPWMETPIDTKKIRAVMPRSIAIFSDNDRFVSVEENAPVFEEKFDSKIIIERNKKHFAGDQGILELPSALEAVLGLYP